MSKTLKLLGTWPMFTFHKGTSYWAVDAISQPSWKAKELIFAMKNNGQSMLLEAGEYVRI